MTVGSQVQTAYNLDLYTCTQLGYTMNYFVKNRKEVCCIYVLALPQPLLQRLQLMSTFKTVNYVPPTDTFMDLPI